MALVGLAAVVTIVTPQTDAQEWPRYGPTSGLSRRLPGVPTSWPAVSRRSPSTGPNNLLRIAQATSPGSRESETREPSPADRSGQFTVPLAGRADGIVLDEQDGLISLVVRDGSLQDVLTAFAETQGLNIVTATPLDARLTITLERKLLEYAFDAILSAAGFTWSLNEHGIIHVTDLTQSVAPEMQGRRVEVFQLD